MAVTNEDLKAPAGEVEDGLFPGMGETELNERLDAYIADAADRVADLDDQDTKDEATKAWCYYRAFSARAQQLASMPASTQIPNEIATTRTDSQRAYFEEQAAKWLGEFNAMFPSSEDSTGSSFPPTGSNKTKVTF